MPYGDQNETGRVIFELGFSETTGRWHRHRRWIEFKKNYSTPPTVNIVGTPVFDGAANLIIPPNQITNTGFLVEVKH